MMTKFTKGLVQLVLLLVFGICICANMLSAQTNGTVESASALNQRAERLSTISPEVALRSARAALEKAGQEKNIREQAQANAIIGAVLRFQDQYDSALVYQKLALALFRDIRDTLGIAGALVNIGGVYQSRGDYASAMEHYFQALILYELRGDKRGIAKSRASIGVAYTLKGELPAALEAQRQALTLRTTLHDEQGIAHSLRNIGHVQEKMHNLDSALWFYEQALKRFERIGDMQGVALSLGSLGNVFDQRGENNNAREFYIKAIPLHEQLGDKRGLAVVHNNIAAGFLRQNDARQALRFAERALRIAEEIGAWAEQRDANKHLADAYTALGNETLAFAAFRNYVTLKDSIQNIQNSQRISDLQTRYDIAEKDRALAAAEHARNVEQMNARNVRLTLVIAIVVFAIIIGLLVNGYRIKRHSERTLRRQNEEILYQQKLLQEQAEEIAFTNKELLATNSLLEEKNELLSTLNTEKNEFLGIAAHDLKNPLANILLTVQLMEEYKPQEGAEKFVEWIQSVTRSAEYMLNIIRNLLDVNKIEAGKVEMHLEPIDVALVELIADAYAFRAEEKGIRLVIEPPKQRFFVLADHSALQQVLENLISNAIKFSPHGKSIYVKILSSEDASSSLANGHLSGDNAHKPNADDTHTHKTNDQLQMINGYVRLEIADEGPGISEEDMKKMFGKFARLSARPTGGEHSTGLGLSIVKKMVEAMNGRVWCESELGKGATFVVELPRTKL
ncbi:MAG: tetratricopeptide repeat-containing sensor histidine kinase [Candidatus Kapabacteria bacterium]|nr:tetratricopeptide repeat-containing sensor histidine kinase [Candidatus Kapabacteria bacterium]